MRRIVWAVAVGFAAAAWADDPFAPNKKPAGNDPADGPDWGVPRPAEKTIVPPKPLGYPLAFAPSGTLRAVVEQPGKKTWWPEVRDLGDGRVVCRIDWAIPESVYGCETALSGGGKWLAVAPTRLRYPDTKPGDGRVDVYSAETGNRAFQIPSVERDPVVVLAFAGPDRLAVGREHADHYDLWDVPSGQRVGTTPTPPGEHPKPGRLAFSLDGRRYALVGHRGGAIHDTTTGATVAALQTPGSWTAFTGSFSNICDLAFSPDGRELAAFKDFPSRAVRLMCWDSAGQVTYDEPVPYDPPFAKPPQLGWLPDRSGWMSHGYAISRAAKKIVLSVRGTWSLKAMPHAADRRRVAFVRVAQNNIQWNSMDVVTVDWSKLGRSLILMSAGGSNLLSPTDPVSVEVDLPGNDARVAGFRTILTAAVTKRLARDGVRTVPDRPGIFRVRFVPRGVDVPPLNSPRSAVSERLAADPDPNPFKGAVVAKVVARATGEVAWRAFLRKEAETVPPSDFPAGVPPADYQSDLSIDIGKFSTPYFVPAAAAAAVLPAFVD